jgi:hypothetical protein
METRLDNGTYWKRSEGSLEYFRVSTQLNSDKPYGINKVGGTHLLNDRLGYNVMCCSKLYAWYTPCTEAEFTAAVKKVLSSLNITL